MSGRRFLARVRPLACLVLLLVCGAPSVGQAAPSLPARLVSPAGRAPRAAAATSPETGGQVAAAVRRHMAAMGLAAKVGQIFMVSFPDTEVTQPLIDWLRTWRVGGIIIYGRNVSDNAQLARLIAGANRIAVAATGMPLLVGIDQEGGLVERLQYGPASLPAPAWYGGLGTAGITRVNHDAYTAGLALRRLGISINFAPVVDVLSDPTSPIGTRSYGTDPVLDGQLAAAAIRGYQAAGIAATAKHFLGLGSTGIDAHADLPTVTASRAWLESHDLVAFRAAIAAGVDALMTTHVILPALDPTLAPANLSHPMVSTIIRGELGFRGVIVSDSLLMGAVTGHLGVPESAVRAVAAGNDLILLSQSRSYPPDEMHAALLAVEDAVRHGQISMSRLDDAVSNVLTLKARLGLLPR